jgi:pyruvate dehydrogenase E2 component (dihydrolipoamide acetyltransferase)
LIAADTPARALRALAPIALGGDREALAKAHAAKMSDPTLRTALTAIRDQVLLHAARVFAPVDWSRIAAPVRLIWGDADRVIPCPAAADLPAYAAVERLAGVGHLPQIERPSAVIAMLERTIEAAQPLPAPRRVSA